MFNNSNWYIVNHWAPVCHSQIHPRWDLTTGSVHFEVYVGYGGIGVLTSSATAPSREQA